MIAQGTRLAFAAQGDGIFGCACSQKTELYRSVNLNMIDVRDQNGCICRNHASALCKTRQK